MRKKTIPFCILALLVLAPLSLAQVNMGEMRGYVYDEQGAIVIGAQVTLTSTALMGGRTTETNEKGLYRFITLPPGEYSLKVTKESYKQYEQKGITISVGKTTGLDIILEVGSFEAVITVIGDAPLIDVESSQQKINITGELQRALPTTIRSNFSEVLRVSPGATLNDPNRPQYSYYSVGGASAYYENNWTIDGARMNQWEYSYMSTRINLDSVEDVEIGLAGSNASNPVGQGGTVHLTTKSGGNEFHGTATFRYQPTSFNDNNIEGGSPADNDFTEYGFSLGGYVLKDKLWFFGTGRITKINEGLSRTPDVIAKAVAAYPGFTADRIDKNMKDLFIKGTYMHSEDHQFTFGYQRDWGYETFAFAQWAPEAYIDEGTVGPMMNGTWNWFVNDNLNVFTQVSFFDKDRDRFGRTRNQSHKQVYENTYVSGGLIYGQSPIVYYGNYATEFQVVESMLNINSTANYFLDDLYGTHDLKIGTSIQPANKNQFMYHVPTSPLLEYYTLSDPNDPSSAKILYYRQSRDRTVQEYPQTTGKDYAFFVNDTWRPNSRMTIEAGVRVDLISQSEELYDVKADNYISTTAISPNLGLNYALTEDRKNILRASYSLRHQNVTAYTFPSSNLGIQHGSTSEYDTDLNGTLETIVRVNEVLRDPDPSSFFDDVSLGYSHDIILGYSRELPFNSTLSVDYSYRQFRNMLTEYNINPIIENGVFVGVVDPTRPSGEWITTRNNKWSWKEYQSINFTFSRVASPITILASLMYEHGVLKGTWGPYGPPSYGDVDDWFAYLQPNVFNNYSDAGGRWGGGDRGLTYRINATYLAPWGIQLAAQIMGQSGPRSGYLFEYLGSNDPDVTRHGPSWLLQDGYWVYNPLSTTVRATGSDRKADQWRSSLLHVVNIRVGKEFKIKDHGFEISFDVFNLFNTATSLEPDTRGTYNSTYYGQDSPYDLLSARSAQMMLRYSF